MMKAFQQARKISKGDSISKEIVQPKDCQLNWENAKIVMLIQVKKISAYCYYWSNRPFWWIPNNGDKVEEHYCMCDGCMLLLT